MLDLERPIPGLPPAMSGVPRGHQRGCEHAVVSYLEFQGLPLSIMNYQGNTSHGKTSIRSSELKMTTF